MHSANRRIAAIAALATLLSNAAAAAAHATPSPRAHAVRAASGDVILRPGRDTDIYVRIRSLYNDGSQCLDLYSDEGAGWNGTRAQSKRCGGDPGQVWIFHPDQSLESVKYPGKCLDADANGGGENGTRLQIWRCNGSPQQKWLQRPDDLAIYNQLFLNGYNTVIDRDSNVPGNGAQVQLWQKNFMSQQWWQVELESPQ